MIFRLLRKWFGKKVDEAKKTKSEKKHPLFELPPNGVRLFGLIRFKPSSGSYFLLNEDKILTKLPSELQQVVSAISHFTGFGLNIYRAYIQNGASFLQFHYEGLNLLDIIYFNIFQQINIKHNIIAENEWRNLLGKKVFSTPEPNKITFERDWSPENPDPVQLVNFYENYFEDDHNLKCITLSSMLYKRTLPDGNPEIDIEYLLASICQEKNNIISLNTGIRIEPHGLEIL